MRVINGLDGNGTVSTVAGDGSSSAFGGDYGPATAAQFYQPYSLTFTPSGHLLISDYYNYAFREVW